MKCHVAMESCKSGQVDSSGNVGSGSAERGKCEQRTMKGNNYKSARRISIELYSPEHSKKPHCKVAQKKRKKKKHLRERET